MTKSLLQLNIRPFVELNKCVFCTCKYRSDRIPELQGVHFPSYLLLNLFIFLYIPDDRKIVKLIVVNLVVNFFLKTDIYI